MRIFYEQFGCERKVFLIPGADWTDVTHEGDHPYITDMERQLFKPTPIF